MILSFLQCEFGALVVFFLFPVLLLPNQSWLNLVSLVVLRMRSVLVSCQRDRKCLGFSTRKALTDNFIQLEETCF